MAYILQDIREHLKLTFSVTRYSDSLSRRNTNVVRISQKKVDYLVFQLVIQSNSKLKLLVHSMIHKNKKINKKIRKLMHTLIARLVFSVYAIYYAHIHTSRLN